MDILDKEILARLKDSVLDKHTDLNAEGLVSGLVHLGIPEDQIIIEHKNARKRACRKDVSGFQTRFIEYDDKEYIFLHTNRDGIYDTLPEYIFHQEKGGRTEKNKYEVIDQIRTHREEEKEARKFFLPFENEFNCIRYLLYTLEEDFEKNFENSRIINIFSFYWPLLKRLDTHHAYIFLRIIPLIHQIRNDWELVSKSMSMILNAEINIQVENSWLFDDELGSPSLGESVLGQTSVIGTMVSDGEADLIIRLESQDENYLKEFLIGGSKNGLIEELADFFIGANYFVKVEYEIKKSERQIMLDGTSTILGFNAQL